MIKQISDNVHEAIIIENELILELINSKEVKRLMEIKQLGLTHYIYPTATHNRYSHSLGTYEISRKFLNRLKVEDERQRNIILSSALLHDIGHGPMSHLFEGISKHDHEDYTILLIESDESDVNAILNKYGILEDVVKVISKKHEIQWMNDILSSELDVDRLDYLIRDSIYTGKKYGLVNLNWLLRNVELHEEQIVYNEKAIHAIEQFIIGRYHMYMTVYLNSKGIVFQELYKVFFERLFERGVDLGETFNKIKNGEMLSYSEFMKLSDSTIVELFKEWAESDIEEISSIARMLWEKKLPDLHKGKESKHNIQINKDFASYGAKVGEQAKVLIDGELKAISEISPIIKKAQEQKDEKNKLVIGINI